MRPADFSLEDGGLHSSHRRWTYPALGISLIWVLILSVTLLREVGLSASTLGVWLGFAVVALVLLAYSLGRQVDRLETMSVTDSSTGLLNRHYFDLCLRQETARTLHHHTPLTLLVIDVDHLKAINDAHGHQAGDRALRMVADSLKSACRQTDVVARYGGDEFVVLAPRTTATQGVEMAERIRAVLRETVQDQQLDKGASPTVSIGVADLETAGAQQTNALFAASDRALYSAKQVGKDRVVMAGRIAKSEASPDLIREAPRPQKGNLRWMS
jgi:diguanylate cyclase (GGDEF)-like protein